MTSIGLLGTADVGGPARLRIRPHVLVVVGLLGALATTWMVVTSPWFDEPFDRVTSVMALVPAWTLPVGAWLLWRGRPSSRSAWLMFWLGVAWSVWISIGAMLAAGSIGSTAVVVQRAALLLVRPLMLWLLLSWPTGKLRRSDAWAIAAYGAFAAVSWGVVPLLFDPELGDDVANPVMIAELPAVVDVFGAVMGMLVLPLAAVLVVAVMWRRYGQLPVAARYAARPPLVAGIVYAAGEIVMTIHPFIDELTNTDDGVTLAGAIILPIDWLRFAVPPVVLMIASTRVRRLAASASRVRRIEAGATASAQRLAEAAATALGDSTARTAFATEHGWVDSDGASIEVGGVGRRLLRVERDGEPVAAVELAPGNPPTSSALAAVASAAGMTADLERVEALARARRAAALAARRQIVDLSDATRHEIQRDLHDGAQQRLVGINLRIRLAAREGGGDSVGLVDEVDRELAIARRELSALVDGEFETRARSLAGALSDLARRVPIPVDTEFDGIETVPGPIRAAAWFVASEVTTNAVKYSNASRLKIRTHIDDDHLHLVVADDGVGGAVVRPGGGLAGLRDRVGRLGGRLGVDSAPGGGTAVSVLLPIGVAV